MRKVGPLISVAMVAFLIPAVSPALRQGASEGSKWHIKKIAFEVGPIPDTAIFVLDPPGSKPKQIVRGEAPSWSPDGARLAYCTRMGFRAYGQIQAINADGSARVRISNVKGGACSPHWSPDGKSIAFTEFDGKRGKIWIVDQDGANPRFVTEGGLAGWSPDGKQLLFGRFANRRAEEDSFWTANVDGTVEKKVAEVSSEVLEATWLPEGGGIAIVSERDRVSSIFRISLDGTGMSSIAADPKRSFFFPVFSPDGRQLLVDATAGRGDPLSILLIDLSSFEAKRVVNGGHPSVIWEQD